MTLVVRPIPSWAFVFWKCPECQAVMHFTDSDVGEGHRPKQDLHGQWTWHKKCQLCTRMITLVEYRHGESA